MFLCVFYDIGIFYVVKGDGPSPVDLLLDNIIKSLPNDMNLGLETISLGIEPASFRFEGEHSNDPATISLNMTDFWVETVKALS